MFGVVSRAGDNATRRDHRKVGHRDHPAAGIAFRVTEGIELLQVDVGQPRFFLQLAQGCGLQPFVQANKATWDGPHIRKWGSTAAYQ